MKHAARVTVLLAATAAAARLLAADATTNERRVAPPLAGLPSAPGPHIAQIQALGDNQWLKLPETAADANCPSWGGKSYGRSWTPRACYAPELGGAFITGEANHGGTDRKTMFYGDDVWFYDLYANRWIALYPGTHIPTFAEKLKDGTYTIDTNAVLRDKTGSAVPVVTLGGHGGWGVVYDKANRVFAWFGTTVNTTMFGPFDTVQTPYEEAAKAKNPTWFRSIQDRRPGIWTYGVATGKFDFGPLTGAPTRYEASTVYVDSRKQLMRPGARKNEAWYDNATRKLTLAKLNGDAPPPANSYGCCYDSKRDRVWVFGSANLNEKAPAPAAEHLWCYDVKTDAWRKPAPREAPQIQIENGRFMMEYDSANDRVVILYIIHTIKDPAGRNIHVYDPASNRFEKPIPVTDKELPAGFGHSFYCPELNAYFIHTARADNAPGNTYVWRYKRAGENQAP